MTKVAESKATAALIHTQSHQSDPSARQPKDKSTAAQRLSGDSSSLSDAVSPASDTAASSREKSGLPAIANEKPLSLPATCFPQTLLLAGWVETVVSRRAGRGVA